MSLADGMSASMTSPAVWTIKSKSWLAAVAAARPRLSRAGAGSPVGERRRAQVDPDDVLRP